MKIEAQLAELAELGLTLEPGVAVDDLLSSFDREAFEKRPFDLLLVLLGSEVERKPWGRRFSRHAWNFDTECVEGDGAYVRIVDQLAKLADATQRLSDVRDHVDHESEEAWLEYLLDGKRRHYDVEVQDDWADAQVVSEVMEDLEGAGRHFYAKDNGQAMV